MRRLAALALVMLLLTILGCSGASRTGAPGRSSAAGDPQPAGGQQQTGVLAGSYSASQPDVAAAPVDLGPTPAYESVRFSVSLRLPGEAQLSAYLAGLTTPGSASYRQYLSAGPVRRALRPERRRRATGRSLAERRGPPGHDHAAAHIDHGQWHRRPGRRAAQRHAQRSLERQRPAIPRASGSATDPCRAEQRGRRGRGPGHGAGPASGAGQHLHVGCPYRRPHAVDRFHGLRDLAAPSSGLQRPGHGYCDHLVRHLHAHRHDLVRSAGGHLRGARRDAHRTARRGRHAR